jgi:hypothetical protein
MPHEFKESDWKVFRRLHPIALERFCERILAEIEGVLADQSMTSHERYIAVYRLVKRRDKEVANLFNDFRRSTALQQIALIQSHKLWSNEEMAEFSDDVREVMQSLLGT